VAVPLIDSRVIKKGSLSPCLTKKSSELRRAARFGNAASELLQNPAFPVTQISFSRQKYHQVVCKSASWDSGECKLQSSTTFPFATP